MKILVVSDSHSDSGILDELAEKYHEKMDQLIHCGDSELADDNLIWSVMTTVAGNCDYYSHFPAQYLSYSGDLPFMVVHGHRHSVKTTREYLLEAAFENQVRCVFYGHSHVLKVEYVNGVLLLNPGSISQPRGEIRAGTYCIVEATKETVSVAVYNRAHRHLPEYDQLFHLTI